VARGLEGEEGATANNGKPPNSKGEGKETASSDFLIIVGKEKSNSHGEIKGSARHHELIALKPSAQGNSDTKLWHPRDTFSY